MNRKKGEEVPHTNRVFSPLTIPWFQLTAFYGCFSSKSFQVPYVKPSKRFVSKLLPQISHSDSKNHMVTQLGRHSENLESILLFHVRLSVRAGPVSQGFLQLGLQLQGRHNLAGSVFQCRFFLTVKQILSISIANCFRSNACPPNSAKTLNNTKLKEPRSSTLAAL